MLRIEGWVLEIDYSEPRPASQILYVTLPISEGHQPNTTEARSEAKIGDGQQQPIQTRLPMFLNNANIHFETISRVPGPYGFYEMT